MVSVVEGVRCGWSRINLLGVTPGQCTGDDQLLNTCTGTISLCLGTALRLLDLTTKDWYKKSDLYLKSTLQVNYVQYTVQFLASNLFPHSIIYKSIPNWNSWVFFSILSLPRSLYLSYYRKTAFKIFSISHIKKNSLLYFCLRTILPVATSGVLPW